ncbi:hypothetical protein BE21_17230 [Sorangium cellulosum]|uniref:Uncharacterized protein n=1 Tax=Sorangium cellulosum TaxID=56 RepID=A0A150TXY3_SORCE|nr:hypothetical protein BE21_17230 [Sorangium cellulosum]
MEYRARSTKRRAASGEALTPILADALVLRDLHERRRWQVSGPPCHPLRLRPDKPLEEQTAPIDLLGDVRFASPLVDTPLVRATRAPARPPPRPGRPRKSTGRA